MWSVREMDSQEKHVHIIKVTSEQHKTIRLEAAVRGIRIIDVVDKMYSQYFKGKNQ